ncbi:MAG TPA: hypothetical protein VFQ06_08330 [Nitrospira sp.]|nr:hypothetical protein [Nitrospira sp.]
MALDLTDDSGPSRFDGKSSDSVEFLLFDSLVHHLIEKGVLTKNDALSVVQTAAEVVRGKMHECGGAYKEAALSMLERTYSSFEALPDRHGRSRMDGHNVRRLRPPLHGDRPHFPSEDD